MWMYLCIVCTVTICENKSKAQRMQCGPQVKKKIRIGVHIHDCLGDSSIYELIIVYLPVDLIYSVSMIQSSQLKKDPYPFPSRV
jgi:hypothetical protein